jgi:hypothetical protein
MAEKIFEASELPESEKVYLKKDTIFKEWRVVYPVKNEEGKINYFRLFFGSKTNLAVLLMILVLIGLVFLGVDNLIGVYKFRADNPCVYCENCQDACRLIFTEDRNYGDSRNFTAPEKEFDIFKFFRK